MEILALQEIPKELKCPITDRIMVNPTLIASGITFEN